jgi:hypothetical protein
MTGVAAAMALATYTFAARRPARTDTSIMRLSAWPHPHPLSKGKDDKAS